MAFLRQNRMPLAVLLLCGGVLAVIFLIRNERAGSTVTGNQETTKIVDIIVATRSGNRSLQIRDESAIVLLQTIFDGEETVDSTPPGLWPYQIFFHPPGKSTYTHSPEPVWSLPDGGFAWRHDGKVTRLNGSFTDFVDWLRVRRINQLRRSADPDQRKIGQQLRDDSLQELSAALIRMMHSPNGWFAQAGIRETAAFLNDEARAVDLYVPARRYPIVFRNVTDPERKVCRELLHVVASSPKHEHTDDPFGAASAALQCLQVTGDRQSADALVRLLPGHSGGRLGEEVLATIEVLYGIPKTYERFGICGNSTREEIEEFQKQEARRQKAAIDDLVNWLEDHAQDTDEEFADAVVARWSEVLVHIATNAQGYVLDADRTPAPRIASLLNLGEPVVPALRRRQQNVQEWPERAMLEFAIAFITGKCDHELVDELLTGHFDQRRMACSIIAVTGQSNWDDQLVKLLRTPLPDSNVEKVSRLRDVAAQALYRSRGARAVPEFKTALDDGFESRLILDLLRHLEVPESPF